MLKSLHRGGVYDNSDVKIVFQHLTLFLILKGLTNLDLPAVAPFTVWCSNWCRLPVALYFPEWMSTDLKIVPDIYWILTASSR